ncbi:hypothetical protein [Yinghuangia soli]|uniref:Uncharacterized protein n=1 Tax=Yinghuangia soli TaxID=2908204 RepID=A0AA41Q5G5_9ACTN|nr:hypothetical protein [Yinghuangia soli]MCF2530991.1 hypothetical protein [Yinghuangia soli]
MGLPRSGRVVCGAVVRFALVLSLVAGALVALASTTAQAEERVVCKLSFTLTTGEWGLRNDSIESVSFGGANGDPVDVIFEDADGDGTADADGGSTERSGGTNDTPHTTFHWNARLERCVSNAELSYGFRFKHRSPADDCCADNWDLKALRIVDPDSGQVYFDQTADTGYLHRFRKNFDNLWDGTPRGLGNTFVDPTQICRLAITVSTGEWGLRNDSKEEIRFGGQPVIFEDVDSDGIHEPVTYLDSDGDWIPDRPDGTRYHSGGTWDDDFATFTWNASLSPCVPQAALFRGFEIRHISEAPDIGADNWDLQGLRITDRDTGQVYLDRPVYDGPIHRFFKNADQTWSSVEGPLPLPEPALDTDGDGLTDRVELFGIPHDGELDTWLPAFGSDPCRRTVAVEIDWLNATSGSDRPRRGALDEARHMFTTAPTQPAASCPYGWTAKSGVQLLIDVSQAVQVSPAQRATALQPSQPGSMFAQIRSTNFAPWREGSFFYSLWGDNHNGTSSSGACCWGPKQNDFVVTLGSWGSHTEREESATFVHELGHALGLHHGGGDHANFKPNYLSVMNYRYQAAGIPDFSAWTAALGRMPAGTDFNLATSRQLLESVSHLDYSRAELPTLVANALDERAGIGIGAGLDSVAVWPDATRTLRVGDATGPLDWDGNGTITAPAGTATVHLLSAWEVCVKAADIAGQPPGQLQTSPVAGDDLLGKTIIAGFDGICSTPATGNDVPVVPQGTNYRTAYGYQNGLMGHDDWRSLLFRIGDTPEARVPLPDPPHPGISKPESDRQVLEMLDALRGATAPASPPPRWGFAYADQATAPIGTETVADTRFQWTTGRRDPATAQRRATVTRTGTGTYLVRLPDVASDAGTAHVTATRTVYRGRSCRVADLRPDGPDQLVQVACHDQNGAPIDWWFMVFFAAPTTGGTPYATLRYDAPNGSSGLEPAVNSGTFNSAGRTNSVQRLAPGRYLVTLQGAAFAAANGYTQLTPYGSGPPAHCEAENTRSLDTALEITVGCYRLQSGATAEPADSQWLLSYTQANGLHHEAGTPAAYTALTGNPGAPAVDAARSFSTGGLPTITHPATGHYRLTYPDLAKPLLDTAQVQARTPGSYCHLGTVNSYSAAPAVSVDVYCHNAAGTPADALFSAAYVRAP